MKLAQVSMASSFDHAIPVKLPPCSYLTKSILEAENRHGTYTVAKSEISGRTYSNFTVLLLTCKRG